jgi:hypothetical protein
MMPHELEIMSLNKMQEPDSFLYVININDTEHCVTQKVLPYAIAGTRSGKCVDMIF